MNDLADSPQLLLSGMPTVSDWSWYLATDPCVRKTRTNWSMFFTAMNSKHQLGIFEATPNASGLSSNSWKLLQNTPILPPGSAGSWDDQAVETACYVKGIDKGVIVERIYYTGWRDPALFGGKGTYQIGYAQLVSGKWVKANSPVIPLSDTPMGSIQGDQSVLYDGGLWHMFFQRGKYINNQFLTTLMYTSSVDGIVWQAPVDVKFAPPNAPSYLPNGPYHVDVTKIGNKFYFVGWLPKTSLKEQGIWVTISKNPTPVLSTDFDNWYPLLTEGSASAWFTDPAAQAQHEIGLFGSDLVQSDSSLWLFFHYTKFTASRDKVGQIARAKVSLNLLSLN